MPFIKNVAIFAKKITPVTVLPLISAGTGDGNNAGHSLILKISGRAFGWSGNINGQLGDATATCRFTPVSVAGAVKTFCKISAGERHSLAIDKSGKVWAWGAAQNGALGNFNAFTDRNTPISVIVAETFCKISAGYRHSVAINKNGRAWGWGNNQNGQLGINSTLSQNGAASVLGGVKTFCEISAGVARTLAIDKNGQVWAWGYNAFGQLGDNSVTDKCTPVSIAGATKTFCSIDLGVGGGANHSIALDKNGRAWGWGNNNNGQLGDNSTISQRTPVSVLGAVKTFCKISTGKDHSIAIDKNGRAWSWGNNQNGQLGDNTLLRRLTPVSVAGTAKTFCEISAGGSSFDYTLGVDKNGNTWAWGYAASGFLGNNNLASKRTPVSVLGATKTFCQITTGNDFTMAIDKNGRAWGWGINSAGKLGDNTLLTGVTPVSVAGAVKTFCKIATGDVRTLAIDKNGRVWGWGNNFGGGIGNNSTTSQITPVSILGATKTFCQIASGQYHSLAIDKNGRAWGWGYNVAGHIGDNSITSRLTPVSVDGAVKTFCKIDAGVDHSLAIDKNGQVWAWGFNSLGRLGNNSTVSQRTPVSILGNVKTFCQISGGGSSSVGIDKNGRVWCWGNNGSGQLGDNTTTPKCTPVSVLGTVKTFCKITAGNSFTVAIDKNGRAWAWGGNGVGELGDNSITSRLTPVSVAGAVKTFCKITAGNGFTVAIDKNGRVWGWGLSSSRQLGDNYLTQFTTPIRVCTL